MNAFPSSRHLMANAIRGYTGHAPLGTYRERFKLPGPRTCPCQLSENGREVDLTREHVLFNCRYHGKTVPDSEFQQFQRVMRGLVVGLNGLPDYRYNMIVYCGWIKSNPKAFSFETAPDLGG